MAPTKSPRRFKQKLQIFLGFYGKVSDYILKDYLLLWKFQFKGIITYLVNEN